MQSIPPDEIRPVPATEARWTADGVEFELEDTVVKVDEDDGRLRAVLDACDGRRTVAELREQFGADASDLLVELRRAGALVDVDGSWRRFHRLSDNPPPASRSVSDEEANAMVAETFVPSVSLGEPVPMEAVPSAVGRAAHRRASALAEPEARPLQWDQLQTLLRVAYGKGERWFSVPSGGALYPLVLHVVVRTPLGPLEPGIWWYDHWRGVLRPQTSGRPDVEPLLFSHPITDPLVERGEPLLTISADLSRTCRKYGARGYRFALMETGAVMQTAYLVGAELGIPIRACGGYHDAGMNRLLGHPDGVVCMLVMLAGA